MSEQETEATFLVGMRTREEVLGLPPDDPDPTFAQPKRPPVPFRPIAHIGKWGTRRGLCGAETLGIFAFGEFDLCLRCKELHGGDPREMAARG